MAGADSGTVATTMVVEVADIKASISNGVGDDVVGAGPIVWTSSVFGGVGKGASELGGGLGGSSVLSIPSVSPPVVTTTLAPSPASASRAAWASLPSFWNSVEQVTSTSGRFDSSSQAGNFAGGSQMPGPTMRTLGGQSERGYSNGSAVM